MLTTTKAHRFLSALVVVALVLGAGLPLVHYACGMTGATATATPIGHTTETLPADTCQDEAGCQDTSSQLPIPPTSSQAKNLDGTCCTLKAADKAPTVVASETIPLRMLLSAGALTAAEVTHLTPSFFSSLSRRVGGVASVFSHVSVRLRTSTFLL